MTKFLFDILRQPAELERSLAYLAGPAKPLIEKAVSMIQSARYVYLTGIGSSWHAALTAAPIFSVSGRPVYQSDTAELLHFSELPRDSVVIMISRTGRSIEIVQLLEKSRAAGIKVIAITNSKEGPLATGADLPIVVPIDFDHSISVNTYSTLALTVGVVASHVAGSFTESVKGDLSVAIGSVRDAIPIWRKQLENSSWLAPGKAYYFLARGSSLGTCNEVRLLWEEGVKSPACAMGTGAFRHGPQEIVVEGMRFGIWIDAKKMREQDLAVARDLRQLGASVMLIGQDLPHDFADLVLQLPAIPSTWQFAIDAVPAQLAAECLSRKVGVDCDTFRLCSYIVEDDSGLLPTSVAASEHGV
jgi:glucosamine--fructose-6-phosphate aminotransferase (isomerizing)